MDNEHAVLQRIVSLFTRYRLEISRMSMGETELQIGSNQLLTLSFKGEEEKINVLLKKLERIIPLVEVRVNSKLHQDELTQVEFNRHQLFSSK